jgi:outer membrane protein assembly factor BamB
MGTDVLIELDLGPVDAAPPRLPSRRYRSVGLALAALLAAALGGAVARPAIAWQLAGAIPAPTSSLFEMNGDLVHVAEIQRGRTVVSTYSAHPFRRLWTADLPVTAAQSVQLVPAGPEVVVVVGGEGRPSSTVRDARTGEVRWTSAAPVEPVAGSHTGLVQDELFRPGTEYDQVSGDAGTLYFSSGGTPYSQPPISTSLRGVDLATGRQSWSAQLAGSIFAEPAGANTVVVVSAGRLQVRDGDTGQVRRERALPAAAAGAPEWSQIIGDLLVLQQTRTSDEGAPTTSMTAYALDTLEPRWFSTGTDGLSNPRSCVDLLCTSTSRAMTVRDPATGAPLWETDGSVDLYARRGDVLEAETASGDPLPVRTVDPATGRARVDLSEWQRFARSAADAPLVLARNVAGVGAVFGVLAPGQPTVRELGRSANPVSACSADERLLACQDGTGIQVWGFRA